ncbi:MAG: hypothetical protein J6Y31_02880 [Bacteroidales bacterium]|nr:hypothetical protein [Bacteroidales bacterium]
MRRFWAIVLFTLLAALPAGAQFYLDGSDPGRLRWNQIQTPHYKVIYPRGADSLALVYGTLLEQFRVPSGRSLGLTPGGRRPFPVVLHTMNGYSNGSVSWAPSRMSLYTVPNYAGANPVSWELDLISHEPRHQAQLQLSHRGWMNPFRYIFGEGASPVFFMFYLEKALAEGDAVAAETGFGLGTRARTADFLDYYRFAFSKGDWRSYERWRYGSFKHYTPDYYTLGYLTVAGTRYFYDYPEFMKDVVERPLRHPFSFTPYNMKRTLAKRSGKRFKEAFADISRRSDSLWQAQAALRGPFAKAEDVTETPDGYPVEYSSPLDMDEAIYLLRNRYTEGAALVRISEDDDEYEEEYLRPMATSVDNLDGADGRLYWSETVGDPRWELSHRSVIRYYDIESGKCGDLTKDSRLYNPHPSESGETLVVVEYPYDGGAAVLEISSRDGRELRRCPAPDGVTPTEAVRLEDSIYATCVEEKGCSLWRIDESGNWSVKLEANIQKLASLGAGDGFLEFVSDRSGANELYNYHPDSGRLVQRTRSRYGISDYAAGPGDGSLDDDYFFVIGITEQGTALQRIPVDEAVKLKVDYADIASHPMEDALAEQDKALGAGPEPLPEAAQIGPAKPYRKLLHPLRLHTWLPVYLNFSSVEEQSMDFSFETASLGATVFFQNTLGTLSAWAGYSASPGEEGAWMHSGHGSITYTGLYPEISLSFDIGGGNASMFTQYLIDSGLMQVYQLGGREIRNIALNADLDVSVPLRFNKGGYLSGFVPRLEYSICNDLFNTFRTVYQAREAGALGKHYMLTGFTDGVSVPVQRFTASARGYFMLPVPDCAEYPRWGIGADAGYSFRPGLQEMFTSSAYAMLYGYVPGFFPTQGVRITASAQYIFGYEGGRNRYFTRVSWPRGFTMATAQNAISKPLQYKLTLDYAIPIYVGDISLQPLTYIRNFVITPHVDYTGFKGGKLWSAGADLTASLAHLFFVPFDSSVGVSFSYLGGDIYGGSKPAKRYSVSAIFSVDF